MSQFETKNTNRGGVNFYIRKMPALKAAALQVDLVAFVGPILGGLAPAVKNISPIDKASANASEELFVDKEISGSMVEPFISALSHLSGDQLITIMSKLLLSGYVSYKTETMKSAALLNEDDLNELFCGDVEDMYLLCYDVFMENYSGFFKKLGSRFGGLAEQMKNKVSELYQNTAN